MKKLLSLLMALVICLSLAGCGSSSGSESSDTSSGSDASTSSSADASTSADADADAVTYPEMELTVSSSYYESETAGQMLAYFLNYITEASGGNITFNVYWGGTFCTATEDLSYVSNGSVDMTILSNSQYTDVLPLSNFPSMTDTSQEYALEYFEYIMFENEETSTLIENEWTQNNIKVLGVNAGGTNAFCAKQEIENCYDLEGMIIGALANQQVYEGVGATFYFSLPPNTYSDLQKGVIDAAGLALAGLVSNAWYEVAPYVVVDGMYSVSNFYTINLDTWNGLDEATQALFLEAAEAATANSLVLNDDEYQNCVDTVNNYNAENGIDAEVLVQGAEYTEAMYSIYIETTLSECMTAAENAGVADEMQTILDAVSEYLGLE